MLKLVEDLWQQIQQNALENNAFLIAFSGGIDSTALLAMFAQLRQSQPNLNIRAVHIHHGLSPNADYWLEHCQAFCQQFNIPFLAKKVQFKSDKNIEENARLARYQALAQIRQDNEIVVTAHHLDDQTETFLLALKRGCGVQGLAAMPVLSYLFDLPIFRPLLAFNKLTLEQYLESNNLLSIYDESNQDIRFERNFLRQQILPLIRKRWPSFDRTVQRCANHCLEQQQLLHELLEESLSLHLDAQLNFDLTKFTDYSLAKQHQLLRLWLAKHKQAMPTQVQLTQILQDVVLARSDAIPQFRLGNKVLRRFQHHLYLTDIFADTTTFSAKLQNGTKIHLPDNLGELSCWQEQQKFCLHWQQKQFYLALPKANQTVSVGFKYSGTVRLTAKSRNKDIKKIWQEYQIPPWQRTRIPLIFYDGQLQSALGVFQVKYDLDN